jgi:Sec-independent protein translocase protein TatA
MKNHIPTTLLRGLLAAGLTAFALARAHADEETTTATVTLSAPGKPATLRVDMPWADIQIVGTDGNSVTVESALAQKGAKPTRKDGLRRLDDEVTFELSEKDNVVTLRMAGENPWASHDAGFKLKVPRAMGLDIKTETGGDLTVKNVEGDLDISNMNGEVKLEGISGSAVVNTMNGEVHVLYAKVPTKLVSITSMNGEVDLRVPADTKANVKLRTHNGTILTDFDDTALKTKTEGRTGNSSSYSYNYSGDVSSAAREAGRAAAEATRMAMEVAREVTREVKREVARAQKEADEDEAKAAADEEKAAKDAAKADKEEAEANATPAPKAMAANGSTLTAPAAPMPPRSPKAARTPRAAIPPITGGKTVTGTLNGGGVDIKISTMNGEITLRQTK